MGQTKHRPVENFRNIYLIHSEEWVSMGWYALKFNTQFVSFRSHTRLNTNPFLWYSRYYDAMHICQYLIIKFNHSACKSNGLNPLNFSISSGSARLQLWSQKHGENWSQLVPVRAISDTLKQIGPSTVREFSYMIKWNKINPTKTKRNPNRLTLTA